jgi:Zn-dependent M28 family amino/carboxypeptidase
MSSLLALYFAWPILAASNSNGRLSFLSRSNHNLRGQKLRKGRGLGRLGSNGVPEQIEEWKDHGKAINSKFSEEQLLELSDAVTTEVYSKQLHDIVDRRFSRYIADKGNKDTAKYIKAQFKALGLKVTEQAIDDSSSASFDTTEASSKGRNVIGFLKGGDLANETVLLGAHYDSINAEDRSAEAPGVDDNGSGSALMLAVARALLGSDKKLRPRRSVMFVAFNAEEEGLFGSEHFVNAYRDKLKDKFGDLKAVLIADEVAWPGSGKVWRQATFETKGHGDEIHAMVDTLAQLATLQNKSSSVHGDGIGTSSHNFVVNYHGFGSDHIPFLEAGIPSVLLIERDNDYHADTYGHSARDTFDHVDLSYGAAMSRLALRFIAAFSSPAL